MPTAPLINREIVRLAIPNILSNISVPLISSVDTALMGRLSELHIGAVGLGAILFNFIYWNCGFLRMGTTGMTAQGYGASDRPLIVHTLLRAGAIALVLAALFIALQKPLGQLAFQLMNVDDRQLGLVSDYWQIRIWDAPATLGLMALMGWFFGMQNALYPLLLTIVVAVVNTSLSYHLVVNLEWSVRGVAYGTVVAQYTGLLLGIALFLGRYRHHLADVERSVVFRWQQLQRFFQVNRDIFLRTLFLTFTFAFFYSKSSDFGILILAVNTIFLQFVNWMSYAIDGFAYAAESLVGKYTGARDPESTWRVVRWSFVWGLGFALLFSGSYWLLSDPLLRVFSSDPEVLTTAREYLVWIVLFPVLAFACYLWDGIYIGLTASRSMLLSAGLAFVGFVGVYFLFREAGNHGLWAALLTFMVGRGVFQGWLVWRRGLALR